MKNGIQLEDGMVKYDDAIYGKNGTDRTQLIVTLPLVKTGS